MTFNNLFFFDSFLQIDFQHNSLKIISQKINVSRIALKVG